MPAKAREERSERASERNTLFQLAYVLLSWEGGKAEAFPIARSLAQSVVKSSPERAELGRRRVAWRRKEGRRDGGDGTKGRTGRREQESVGRSVGRSINAQCCRSGEVCLESPVRTTEIAGLALGQGA